MAIKRFSIKNIILHPWLFALTPIIGLFEHNQDIASVYYLHGPIIVMLLSVTILFFLFNIFIKNKRKTSIIISIFALSFFFFNSFTELFKNLNKIIPYGLMPFDILAINIYIIFLIAIFYLIATSRKKFINLNSYLNIFAITVILLQLASLGLFQYQNRPTTNSLINQQPIIEQVTDINDWPDIYYIVLDGYARADTLANIYDYDNSEFLNSLNEMDFYIADQTYSNYNQTYLSVTSALNLKYINYLTDIVGPESNSRLTLKRLLKDNFVYDFLKARNYTFVSLPSTWTGTFNNLKSDINLESNWDDNDFSTMLLEETPIDLFYTSKHIEKYTKNFLFPFTEVPQIAKIEQPTFSYIHLLTTHPPFIFDKDGAILNNACFYGGDGERWNKRCIRGPEVYREQYVGQLSYMNQKLLKMIQAIKDNSTTPPIIILQGDHGPGSMLDWESLANSNIQERFSILNAYYVPEATKAILYPSISPVNSFRVIFNSVFKSQFEILEDKSYFATWSKPYYFMDVSEQLK